jgi:hypothetical protein
MKVREEPVTPCTIELLAGHQVGKLRQEKRWPQVAHQPLIEERLFAFGCVETQRMAASTASSRSPPPAATILSMARQKFGIAFGACAVEREAGGIGSIRCHCSIWR